MFSPFLRRIPLGSKYKVPDNDVHIRVWFFASDAGPDQVTCEGIIEQETGGSHCDIHLHEFCLFHKVQLIIMKILKVLDLTWPAV